MIIWKHKWKLSSDVDWGIAFSCANSRVLTIMELELYERMYQKDNDEESSYHEHEGE